MTLLDQIQQRLKQLPPEKQSEVLDFITFLQLRSSTPADAAVQTSPKAHPLTAHPAYGSWKKRKIDPLAYEQSLRAEWDERR
jgi:hypothetical protein